MQLELHGRDITMRAAVRYRTRQFFFTVIRQAAGGANVTIQNRTSDAINHHWRTPQ